MHAQTSLVHALMDEIIALRNKAMLQSFCACGLPREVEILPERAKFNPCHFERGAIVKDAVGSIPQRKAAKGNL